MELNATKIRVSVPYEKLYSEIKAQLSPEEKEQIQLVLWKMKNGEKPVGIDPSQLDMVILPFHTTATETTWQYISTSGLSEILAQATQARLFQALSIGIEGLPECIPPNAVLANAVGVMEAPTAELAVTLLLSLLREIPGFIKSGSEWDNHTTPGVIGKRILLLGYGGIGTKIERMLSGFEPKEIIRIATRERQLDDGRKVHSIDQLTKFLPQADGVISSMPLTPETEGFIGKNFFNSLKDGAAFINIGRGAVVKTDALLQAVQTKPLRIALDVTEPEPLPADHPLWSEESLLITPHVGGNSDASHAFQRDLLIDQMRRILAGKVPANIVAGSW